MAIITKSVGATGRDYSTLVLWEADLGGVAGGAGDDAIAECYNDAAFNGARLDITDSTPDSITVTAADGEQHDGTAGTGARVEVHNAGGQRLNHNCDSPFEFSWLEIDGNEGADGWMLRSAPPTALPLRVFRNLLVYDSTSVSANIIGLYALVNNAPYYMQNNIIYNFEQAAGGNCFGILATITTATTYILNNTLVNIGISDVGSSSNARGVNGRNSSDCVHRNNVCCDTYNDGSGTAVDFSGSAAANAEYNASSDSTASVLGPNSLTGVVSADQFISTVSGSENLHLKSDADLVATGTDLVTTPADVEIDIDGSNRDALGVVWDIGAHQYIISATIALLKIVTPPPPV